MAQITYNGNEYNLAPFDFRQVQDGDLIMVKDDVDLILVTGNYYSSQESFMHNHVGQVVTVNKACSYHLHLLECSNDNQYGAEFFSFVLCPIGEQILPPALDVLTRRAIGAGNPVLLFTGDHFVPCARRADVLRNYSAAITDFCDISSWNRGDNNLTIKTVGNGVRRVLINWNTGESALLSECINVDDIFTRISDNPDMSNIWLCAGCETYHYNDGLTHGRAAHIDIITGNPYCNRSDIRFCVDINDWSTQYYQARNGKYYRDEDNAPTPLIREYHHAPTLKYHGRKEDSKFRARVGWELEIECPHNQPEDVAKKVKDATNDHVFFEHDGSLCDGVEIISHPHTIELSKEVIHQTVTAVRSAGGCQSHNGGNCGFHIHVARSEFTELAIAKILIMMIKFTDKLSRFSRRGGHFDFCKPITMDGFRSRIKYTEEDSYEKAEEHKDNGRYYFLNLTRNSTFEFRLFRGSLNANTLIACVDLVTCLCNASDKPLTEIAGLSWSELIKTGTPELIQYCERRGI